jgi:hypothetical protein
MRVVCVSKFEEEPSLKAAVQHAITHGLPDILNREALTVGAGSSSSSSTAARPSVDITLWLRGLFLDMFAKEAAATALDTVENRVANLCEGLQIVCGLFGEHFPKEAADFVADFNAIKMLFECAAGQLVSSSAALQDAVARWNAVEFATVRATVQQTEVMASVLSSVGCALQASSKDVLAAKKFSRALEILTEAELPHTRVSQGTDGVETLEICHFNRVVDNTALESLEESLALISEALGIWSSQTAELRSKELQDWCEAFDKSLRFLDACLQLHAYALCVEGEVVWTAAELPSASQLLDLSTSLNESFVDGSPLAALAATFAGFVQKLPERLGAALAVSDAVQDLAKTLTVNSQHRADLLEMLLSLVSLGEAPASPASALADWRAKQSTNSRTSAYLHKASRFLSEFGKVSSGFASFDKVDIFQQGPFKVEFEAGGATRAHAISLPQAATCSKVLVEGNAVRTVRCLCEAVSQLVLKMFAQSVPLEHGEAIVEGKGPEKQTLELSKIAAKGLADTVTKTWYCQDTHTPSVLTSTALVCNMYSFTTLRVLWISWLCTCNSKSSIGALEAVVVPRRTCVKD